jgi:hypothetical protein
LIFFAIVVPFVVSVNQHAHRDDDQHVHRHFFDPFARPPLAAISRRRSAVSPFARAIPPSRPISAAFIGRFFFFRMIYSTTI